MIALRRLVWNAREARPRALWRLVPFLAVAAAVANPLVLLLDTTDVRLLEGPLENVLIATGFLTALAVSARYIDRRPLRDFGLDRDAAWWRECGVGFVLGGLMATFLFGVQYAAGWISMRHFAWTTVAAPFGVAFCGQLLRYAGGALFEELVTRSYFLRLIAEPVAAAGMTRRGALLFAWLASSVVFGALHLGNPEVTPGSLGNLALLGLLFGLPMVLTGRLGASIGMHMGWNVLLNSVFGLPNSGQPSLTTVLATDAAGPERWTGGTFGPEGGLLMLPAVALGSLVVLGWLRARGVTEWALSLADPPTRESANTT